MALPDLSVVVPVYNEEGVLREFYSRLKQVIALMGLSAEILFVDDGSGDSSDEILRGFKREDDRIRVLSFTRNFGHQIAVKAGLDHCQGNAVVIIDADLQDPPELIKDLWAKWREGYDVVYAVRVHRKGETLFKKWTAAIFYWLIQRISSVDIPRNTGDFRLISRRVVDTIKEIREKNPYLRGLIAWTGYRCIGVPMFRDARYAGQTKYSLKKMFHLAWSGIAHFSFMPLRIAFYMGASCLAAATFFFVRFVDGGQDRVELVLFAVFFVGAIQLLSVGILGAYLGRNYDESRPRPLYIIKKGED